MIVGKNPQSLLYLNLMYKKRIQIYEYIIRQPETGVHSASSYPSPLKQESQNRTCESLEQGMVDLDHVMMQAEHLAMIRRENDERLLS